MTNGQHVVRNGKLAALVQKQKKKQAEKANNKAWNQDGEETDDDFVSNVGDKHGPGMNAKKDNGRKKMDDARTGSVKV
ncbi:hypothetical protein CTI12_AA335600 [Artemisia annua]|uniref:Uncharacterized protein n=1 Tax=Artemisia annua TaxID=35608 RepID=A0A2U1MVL6_ARTAN|nr:hypothetical protein CTI12_AA335600 [Artemisia annua]